MVSIMNETSFEYTYSAKQQKEIEAIRKKYLPKEEDKMEMIRRLDRSTERPGVIISLVVGIVGSLILGIGMCCTMVWTDMLFIPGIIIGLIGMAILSVAYPLYKSITKKQREKVAEKILALSEELAL
ncbi:MAG: hypothetical protein IJ326_04840 [Lachnospiraceae bacterium]|nr:hypothetical protein [Lachnospiraceae bacterium]